MAINIKEILHPSDSDSIKFEKVNYNFDQILINGGGPQGIPGPQGQQGIVGATGLTGDTGPIGATGATGAAGSSNTPWERIAHDTTGTSILKPKIDSDTSSPSIWLGDSTFDEGGSIGTVTGYTDNIGRLVIETSTGMYDHFVSYRNLGNDTLNMTFRTFDGASFYGYKKDIGSVGQLIGFEIDVDKVKVLAPDYIKLNSEEIELISGNDIKIEGVSDVLITSTTSNVEIEAENNILIKSTGSEVQILADSSVFVTSTTDAVEIEAGGGNINLNSANNIQFISSVGVYNFNDLANINPVLDGIVIHNAAGDIGSINTASGFSTGVLSLNSTGLLYSSSGTNTSITRWDGTTEIEDSLWFINDTGDMYPTATTQTLGTAANRIGTLYMNSVIDYSNDLTFNGPATTNVIFTPTGLVGIGVGSSELTAYLNVKTSIRMHRPTSFISGDIQSKFSGDFSILNLMGGAGGTDILEYTDGGHVYLTGGTGTTVLFRPDGDGGKVYINGGIPAGVGSTGNVIIGLDTSDSHTGSKIGVFNDAPVYDFDLLSDSSVGSATGAARIKISETGTSNRPTLSLENSGSIAPYDNSIKFYNRLAAGAINPGVLDSDAAIVFKNGATTSTGLVIGPSGQNNYFRIDGNADINLNATESSSSSINIESAYKISLDYVNTFTGAGVYIGANDTPLTAITSGSNNHIVLIDTQVGADKGKLRRMTGTDLRTFIGAKPFVINHPDKEDSYLVHACIEGPEGAVYYRGESKLENGIMEVELPDYFESLTRLEDRTVQLTPKIEDIDDDISSLAAGRVVNGKFKVKGYNGNNKSQTFYWEVKAVRKDIDKLIVEPSKDDYELKGDGPYTYLVKR